MKFQAEPEMMYDPSKIHKINFDGKHHRCHAYAQTHPSPQRSPVIFQAGASKSGIDFAGKHAEAIYTGKQFPTSSSGCSIIRYLISVVNPVLSELYIDYEVKREQTTAQ